MAHSFIKPGTIVGPLNAGSPMAHGVQDSANNEAAETPKSMQQSQTDKHHANVHATKAEQALGNLKIQREKTHGYGRG